MGDKPTYNRLFTREQRLETLDRQFQELEEHYKSVLEKVAAS